EHTTVEHKIYTIPDAKPKQNITERNNINVGKLFREITIDTAPARDNIKTNKLLDQFRQNIEEMMQEGDN
ncbi:19371_t:CDS:1, partial [Gigaspora margarita]